MTATTEALLDAAGRLCARQGGKLTDNRRHVLGLLLEADAPLGAYDLLERLRPAIPGAVPPTVYRALDFLLAYGLVHKVERLSAFVGCRHTIEAGDAHPHVALFLLCRVCKRAIEFDDHGIERALAVAAKSRGFVLGRSTVEAEGLCGDCAAAA